MSKKVQHVLTLFSSPTCSLCEPVKELLHKAVASAPENLLKLEVVDITTSKTFFGRYKYDIPVVLLDGKEIARHRLTEEQLTDHLVAVKHQ